MISTVLDLINVSCKKSLAELNFSGIFLLFLFSDISSVFIKFYCSYFLQSRFLRQFRSKVLDLVKLQLCRKKIESTRKKNLLQCFATSTDAFYCKIKMQRCELVATIIVFWCVKLLNQCDCCMLSCMQIEAN